MGNKTISWSISETIGVAIVNPRAVTGRKSLGITLTHKATTIKITDTSITIDGIWAQDEDVLVIL